MNSEQNALVVLEEELSELAIELLKLQQSVSKAIRFGMNDFKDVEYNNKERIQQEFNDLIGSFIHLQETTDVKFDLDLNKILLKMEKIKKYEYLPRMGIKM